MTPRRSRDVVTLSRARARNIEVIRGFDPAGELPFRHHRGEIHNRETCESNPREDQLGRMGEEDANTCCALAASNHVAPLSIYLSSRDRKRNSSRVYRRIRGEIYIERKVGYTGGREEWRRRVGGEGEHFLSHETRVSGACRRRYASYKLSDKGAEDTRMVPRSTTSPRTRARTNGLYECTSVKRNGNERRRSAIFFSRCRTNYIRITYRACIKKRAHITVDL